MNKAPKNKKKKRKRLKNRDKSLPTQIYIEYYEPIFAIMHKGLDEIGYNLKHHAIRESFWKIIPPGYYPPYKAIDLLRQYLKIVEREMKEIIKIHSIAYWLHAYRRLSPGPIGSDKREVTIGLTRCILEAAIQKYGKQGACEGIGISNQIPEDSILDGMLMLPQFEKIREELKKKATLVLRKFGIKELKELYDLEKLAYEIWKATSKLRVIGKGAPLIIEEGNYELADDRSDELDKLIISYDKRNKIASGKFYRSSTGVVFSSYEKNIKNKKLPLFLTIYNLGNMTFNDYSDLFKKWYKTNLESDGITNFVFFAIDLNNYYLAHKPFSESFKSKNSVNLESVIAVICSLLYYQLMTWMKTKGLRLINNLKRAYDGPWEEDFVYSEIENLMPEALEFAKLEIDKAKINIKDGIDFLKLDINKSKDIDINYPCPHYIFIPVMEGRIFIDYAWIYRRLDDLFFGVKLSDQNFKGEALEKYIRKKESVLPVKECKAIDGSKKQIDYSILSGDSLIIVECRAIWLSTAFERGDAKAIEYRNNKINEALKEIDTKAKWLIKNPKGKNYDISNYKRIIPIVITPFVEFIPSLDYRYWLSDDFPRIMNPNELDQALEKGIFDKAALTMTNTLSIH